MVFQVAHEVSGIDDDLPEFQTEMGSDNAYECVNCSHPAYSFNQHNLD